MFVIGLTGGIGTGKTEVAHVLKELGAVVIDSDKVAHLSYEPGTEAHNAIVETFGAAVVSDSGTINREALASIVFSDEDKRLALESIVWPITKKWVIDRLTYEENRGSQTVVIEVPKLYEAGWDGLFDVVWTVESPSEMVYKRGFARSNMGKSELRARRASQLERIDRENRADLVIENNKTIKDLRNHVSSLWDTVPT